MKREHRTPFFGRVDIFYRPDLVWFSGLLGHFWDGLILRKSRWIP
jgi:hypothetical protein